jgi:hypothetical protein
MRLASGLALLTLAAGSIVVAAQQPVTDRITVPFSDPSRPGTVRVHLLGGSITIRPSNSREVIVEDASRDDRPQRPSSPPRADGLRRLTQPPGLRVEEEANVVSITRLGITDFGEVHIQVPARTNLQLSLVNGGAISVDGVEGEIEANNVNGGIRLTDVAGTVVAHTVNGRLVATLRAAAVDKPMAFTSLNGDVDVTLPPSLKANLRLRSDQGDVYTDFEVQPTAPPPSATRATPRRPRDANPDNEKGRYRLLMDRAIYGTVNGGGPEFELRTFNGEVYLRKGK